MVVRFIAPGDMFGVAMAIGADKYPGTSTAAVGFAGAGVAQFRLELPDRRHPSLAVNTMQSLGARLQDSQKRILDFSTQQVEQRIAGAVLQLAQQAGEKPRRAADRFPAVAAGPRGNDGSHAAHGQPHAVGLEERGIVEGGRQRVVVCDMAALQALARKEG